MQRPPDRPRPAGPGPAETGRHRRRRLAATLTLGGLAVPALVAAFQLPAAAATGQASGAPVTVTITGMTPQWATPNSKITVTGTVTNESKAPITDLSVQLDATDEPIASAAGLQADLSSSDQLAYSPVTSQSQPVVTTLAPGASATWSIRFRASAIGMSAFGVYPLTAEVDADIDGAAGSPLDYANTFLPYMPAKRGPGASTRPRADPIAWVWPLIDTPLADVPGRSDCSGPQVTALHASLEPGGRLAGLLAAGAAAGQPDQVTWAVDPALLADVNSLANCGGAAPGAARAATAWLAQLRTATRAEPLFVTSYGDIDLGLISGLQTGAADVSRAYTLGREVAGNILHRDVTPVSGAQQGGVPPVTSIAWPPGGMSSYYTEESLAGSDEIQVMLLDSDTVTAPAGTAFRGANGESGYSDTLLYSGALTNLLRSATGAPGSRFATSQEFLALTAMMAGQQPAEPIVAAPPQRWQPPSGLAQSLLAATKKAPWLKAVPLTSLEQHVTRVPGRVPTSSSDARSFSRRVLHEVGAVDQEVSLLASIDQTSQARQALYLSAAALDSSAWQSSAPHSQVRRQQLSSLTSLDQSLYQQLREVRVVADDRVYLGGLKGSVPILIDNPLDNAVTVRLDVAYDEPAGGGVRVQSPQDKITVAAHSQQPVKVHVQATQVGSTTIYLTLENPSGQALPAPTASVTVTATQFGTLAMIILSAALGVFVILSALRAARRGHPAPPDNPAAGGHSEGEPHDDVYSDEDQADASQDGAEPDSVVPEHSELGTAGTSGL